MAPRAIRVTRRSALCTARVCLTTALTAPRATVTAGGRVTPVPSATVLNSVTDTARVQTMGHVRVRMGLRDHGVTWRAPTWALTAGTAVTTALRLRAASGAWMTTRTGVRLDHKRHVLAIFARRRSVRSVTRARRVQRAWVGGTTWSARGVWTTTHASLGRADARV